MNPVPRRNRIKQLLTGNMKWKLFISFLILSVIPTSVTGFFLYSKSYDTIEEKISIYSQQIMIQSVGRLDAMLTSIEDIGLQIVSTKDIQDSLQFISETEDPQEALAAEEELEQMLDQILSSKKEIVGAQILLKDKHESIISGGEIVDSDNYEQSEEFTMIMQGRDTEMWYRTKQNTNPTVLYEYISVFSRRIHSPETGRELGTLLLGIKEFDLADTYSYIDLGLTGFVFMMDKEGRVVSHLSKKSLILKADYDFVSEILGAKVIDNRTFASELDGEKVMISYSLSNVNGWYVVSVIPYDYLMERITKVGTFSIQLGLALLILAIIVSLMISVSISRPVQQLVSAMRKVEEGNFKTTVRLKSDNEIGRLGESFNSMIGRINFLINRVYEEEIMKKQAEIKSLQSQINPHFLYNTLAIIDSIASVKNEKEICEITQILGDIFRYSTSGSELASIEEEIKQVERYMTIHKIRYGDSLRCQVFVDPRLAECKLIKLLIQPLVENALSHGIKKTGTIKVIVLPVDGDKLTIKVEDDGVGMTEAELDKLLRRIDVSSDLQKKSNPEQHIGLVNVNRRIKSYYGEQFGLEIVSEKDIGTKVTLVIPAIKD